MLFLVIYCANNTRYVISHIIERGWVPYLFLKMSHFCLDDFWMSHINTNCKKMQFTTVICSHFLVLKVEIINYEWHAGAVDEQTLAEEKPNKKCVLNQAVNRVCQVQVAGKYGFKFEILVTTNLNSSPFIVSSNIMLWGTESDIWVR